MISTQKSLSGHDVPAFHDGKEWRLLGVKRNPVQPFISLYSASANPVIPRSMWQVIRRDRNGIPILDQGQVGSCVGHASASAMMLSRDISGATFDLLSAPFVYSLINHGVDEGSDPADAAATIQTTGICLMSEFGEPNWHASQIPASAFVTAKRFTAREVYSCANFDEAVSAWFCGFTIFDTILVGNDFNRLDRNGVVPISQGQGNHCTAWGDQIANFGGTWFAEHRNSWSTSWGLDGRCFMGEAHALAQGSWYQCFAIKAVNSDPLDPLNPPGM